MTTAQIIALAIQICMAVIVFCLGLQARARDVTGLLRQPALLARSLLAMYLIVPVIVAALCASFDLDHALKVALIVLAVSPVPPILPKKEAKAGGDASYAVGLLVIAALVAIVFVPGAVTLLGILFKRQVGVSMALVAHVVLTSVLLPLAVGFVVRWLLPNLAAAIAKPLSIAATVVLVAACVPVLIGTWHAMLVLIGNFTLVAIVVVTLIALAVGHLLGGPIADNRTVLALSTAARHPGMAMAIAHSVAPADKAVPAAILLAFLVGTIVTIPYVKRRARLHAEEGLA
jgi:BASS family bile acid:Na+ symporter